MSVFGNVLGSNLVLNNTLVNQNVIPEGALQFEGTEDYIFFENDLTEEYITFETTT